MGWDPRQYEKFRDERAAPFEDLIALGAFRAGMRIVDLGCGTGELTARLAALSPGSDVLGVDSSPSMLAKAAKHGGPGVRFEAGAIERWGPPGPLDLVFSHAALQWVDDHPGLFRRLAGLLAPGGQLLVQMPSNHGHVSHVAVRELAGTSPWKERLGGYARRSPLLAIDEYAGLLHEAGLERPTVLEKVYGHVLADSDGVVEWIKGTLLVPYLERLSPEHGSAFLAELSARFRRELPGSPYYYPFRRTLIAATRPGPR